MKDDGGSAFACQKEVGHGPDSCMEYHSGMSLRDYFAAKAMQSLLHPGHTQIAIKELENDVDEFLLRLAISAYRHADAMIEARNKE